MRPELLVSRETAVRMARLDSMERRVPPAPLVRPEMRVCLVRPVRTRTERLERMARPVHRVCLESRDWRANVANRAWMACRECRVCLVREASLAILECPERPVLLESMEREVTMVSLECQVQMEDLESRAITESRAWTVYRGHPAIRECQEGPVRGEMTEHREWRESAASQESRAYQAFLVCQENGETMACLVWTDHLDCLVDQVRWDHLDRRRLPFEHMLESQEMLATTERRDILESQETMVVRVRLEMSVCLVHPAGRVFLVDQVTVVVPDQVERPAILECSEDRDSRVFRVLRACQAVRVAGHPVADSPSPSTRRLRMCRRVRITSRLCGPATLCSTSKATERAPARIWANLVRVCQSSTQCP